MMKVATLVVAVMLACALHAAAQDVLVLEAGHTSNGIACLMPPPAVPPPNTPPTIPACPLPGGRHLVQGQRTELQVFSRRFWSDYSISIDAVTQIQTGPNIRNLNEAENLTLGTPTFATLPSVKGGTEGLTARKATDILLDLIDETRASGPQVDLDSDYFVLEREHAKVVAQFDDFETRYTLLRGNPATVPATVNCQAALGSADIQTLSICMGSEVATEHAGPFWGGPGPYGAAIGAETEFNNVNTRVQDLIAAVKTLGDQLSGSDLPSRLKALDTAVAQYENDLNTFRGNAEAAYDAARLAQALDEDFRQRLRRQQMKALLSQQLKGGDSKPLLDDAQLDTLLERYRYANAHGLPQTRWRDLENLSEDYLVHVHPAGEFATRLAPVHAHMDVDLPNAITGLNAIQGQLLNRVNEIYDHSEVPDPRTKQIDLSGHSGNLVVYYTIRRIETFKRYKLPQVQGPGGAVSASVEGMALPPSKGAAPSAAPAPQPNASANTNTGAAANATTNPSSTSSPADQSPSPSGNGQTAADNNEGEVVYKGSFEVHDVFHANVVAAIAFSTLKDQSITKLPQPQSCTGTAGTPDPNCFSPQVSDSFKWTPIVGLDYYFQPRDTFPRPAGARPFCFVHPWQCFGVMGAASVTKANSYFFGGFFEPVLGVQFGAGANFGIKTVLQGPYVRNVPADITGDFPTTDKRGTGAFVSAGLDLGIFRKIFGKFTGIGTSASGTSGK